MKSAEEWAHVRPLSYEVALKYDRAIQADALRWALEQCNGWGECDTEEIIEMIAELGAPSD